MSQSDKSSGIERRKDHRAAAHVPISVLGTDRNGKRFEVVAYTANLSHGGMAIASHIALDVGTEVEIRVVSASTTGNCDNATPTYGQILDIYWDKDTREFIMRAQYRTEKLASVASMDTKDESLLAQTDPTLVKSDHR